MEPGKVTAAGRRASFRTTYLTLAASVGVGFLHTFQDQLCLPQNPHLFSTGFLGNEPRVLRRALHFGLSQEEKLANRLNIIIVQFVVLSLAFVLFFLENPSITCENYCDWSLIKQYAQDALMCHRSLPNFSSFFFTFTSVGV